MERCTVFKQYISLCSSLIYRIFIHASQLSLYCSTNMDDVTMCAYSPYEKSNFHAKGFSFRLQYLEMDDEASCLAQKYSSIRWTGV
jgi:hypothetical protein